jgi:hypothetical protein
MTRTYGKSNRGESQLQPLMTVARLKAEYLFGAVDVTDSNGNTISDSALQSYIDSAINMLELDLDMAFTPRQELEERDFFGNDYFNWGYNQLNRYPVISIQDVFFAFLRNDDGTYDETIDIPQAWWRLKKETGLFRMIPNNKFPANLQIDQTGTFFPELFRREGHVPQLFVISYTWGLQEGQIPPLINHAIGMLAAIFALSPLGNLILGPGIASSSLGIDGLSQSLSTTNSGADGGAFASQVRDYKNQLWGQRGDATDNTSIVHILRNYYKGAPLMSMI